MNEATEKIIDLGFKQLHKCFDCGKMNKDYSCLCELQD